MIKVNEKFKEFCIVTFGEEDGNFIHNFYRDFFNYTTFKREGINKSITRADKIANISYLIGKVGKEKFLECVKYFKNDWDAGLITTHSIRYFTTVAENFRPRNRKKVEMQKLSTPSVTPKRFKKVREGMGLESLNWDYVCNCSNIIDAWATECTQCGSPIDWTSL